MADSNGSKLRIALDAAYILSVIGLAFYAGILTQQVADLREAVNTRGRVQISVEASNRLTALETNAARQEMRLTEIERQLRQRD